MVAPLPANKLFNSDGLLAQMNAWNDDTVKTPNLFKIPFVMGVTWVRTPCNMNNYKSSDFILLVNYIIR